MRENSPLQTPKTSPVAPFLRRLLLRSELSSEEQIAILKLPGSVVLSEANLDIVKQGESVDHVSLVRSGIVGSFSTNAVGMRQITAFHIPGDMANLYTVVRPEACSALTALCASTIFKIPHGAIRDLAEQYPAIAEALWRDSIADASILSQWALCVGRYNARTAIAHLICEMAVRYRADVENSVPTFVLPVTQSHLADALALTSVHVSRVLHELRASGLVHWQRQEVRILNWAGLCKAGEFDAHYLEGTKSDPK